MKTLFTLLLSSIVVVSAVAQSASSTVTVKVNGPRDRQVLIDGTAYDLTNNTNGKAGKTVTLTNLQTGQHSIEIKSLNVAKSRWNSNTTTTFNLRTGYDVVINVSANGNVQINELRIKNRANQTTGALNSPLSTSAFNQLYQSVRNTAGTRAKLDAVTNIFRNTNNYYTSSQANQLISLITSQSARLQLAKTAYRGITDQDNYNIVSNLLNSTSARNELSAYISTYNSAYNTNTTVYNNNSSYKARYYTPMTDRNFNYLYNNIAGQYYAGAKLSALRDAFGNVNNYFTTAQARQLILLAPDEATRLELAKAAYRNITDVDNFTSIYDVLQNQYSRQELATYVQNFNSGTVNNDPANTYNNTYRTPMSDANYNTIYSNVQNQWLPGGKYTVIRDAFSTSTNYFTSAQAKQLIQLLSDERNRFELARLSYPTITDPANFNTIYDLFNTQSYRDALIAYVNSYTTSNNNNNNYGAASRMPMTESSFNSLYQSIQNQWLPGAKMTDLRNTFANGTYYFTTAQAKQLIQLVSDEYNRLELAKASYRTITDPANFTQLYDVLSTQASRDELAAYARSYR